MINALLISGWAVALMCIWIWWSFDQTTGGRQGGWISFSVVGLANLLVVGLSLRGFAITDDLPTSMELATGVALALVVVIWIRCSVIPRISRRILRLKVRDGGAHTLSDVKGPASAAFTTALGVVFIAASAELFLVGFVSRHGPPLFPLRLDHPAFLLVLAGIAAGSLLIVVGRVLSGRWRA